MNAPLCSNSVTGYRIWLGLIVLLGLGIRFACIDAQSIWYDEAVTAELTEATYWQLLTGQAADAGNPPFYWFFVKASVDLLGNHTIGLRLVSALCGVLTIVVIASIARMFGPPRAALFCGLLWAVSPLSLELSTAARGYALLHFLVALNSWFFLKWLASDSQTTADQTNQSASGRWHRWGLRLGYAATMAAMCLTHYFAIFAVFAHATALLVMRVRWQRIAEWITLAVCAGASAIYWLPVFLEQVREQGNVSRFLDSWLTQFVATPMVFGWGRTLVWRDNTPLELGLASLAAVLLLWLPLTWAMYRLSRTHKRAAVIILLLLFPLMAPVFFSILLGSPVYHIRAASVALPAFVILAGLGLAQLPKQWGRGALAIGMMIAAVSIVNFRTTPLKDDWRAVLPDLFNQTQPADLLVFDTEIEARTYLYFAKRAQRVPHRMIGLVGPGEQPEDLIGVTWDDGRQSIQQAINLTPEVLKQDRVWVVCIVPYRSPDDRIEQFKQLGYDMTDRLSAHRIEVLGFERRNSTENTSLSADTKPMPQPAG